MSVHMSTYPIADPTEAWPSQASLHEHEWLDLDGSDDPLDGFLGMDLDHTLLNGEESELIEDNEQVTYHKISFGCQNDTHGDADAESSLTKEELRKHKNRQSAARSRLRNRQRMEELEEAVRALEAKNQHLQRTVQILAYDRINAPATGFPMVVDQAHSTTPYDDCTTSYPYMS